MCKQHWCETTQLGLWEHCNVLHLSHRMLCGNVKTQISQGTANTSLAPHNLLQAERRSLACTLLSSWGVPCVWPSVTQVFECEHQCEDQQGWGNAWVSWHTSLARVLWHLTCWLHVITVSQVPHFTSFLKGLLFEVSGHRHRILRGSSTASSVLPDTQRCRLNTWTHCC